MSCDELSAGGKRGWLSSTLVSPTKNLSRDVAPLGDDIEPVGESRADVETGNEEDDEPMEAEFPRARTTPKNPTSRWRNKNMKIQDMLFREIGVLLGKVEVLGDNIELN